MTEITTPPPASPEMGLVARAIGVVVSPRRTFEAVAERPHWFGILVLTTVLTAVLMGGFAATPVGRQAFIDKAQQPTALGGTPSEQQMQAVEKFASYMPYVYGVGIIVVSPIVTAIIAGLVFAVFGAFAGGQATYKQVFAVCTHAGVIGLLGLLVTTPVNYVRETLESPMNLAVFFPMLDSGSFLAKVLGSIGLFPVWSVCAFSIGLAVVYRKKTQSVALVLFLLYAIIAVGLAAISVARS